MLDKFKYYWVRLTTNFLFEPNITKLEQKDPLCITFFLKLLSKTANLGGLCRDNFSIWDYERIAAETGIRDKIDRKKRLVEKYAADIVEEYLNDLKSVKLVERKNGCWRICNIENLVGKETYGAQRKRDQRAAKKEEEMGQCPTDVPTNVPSNVPDNSWDNNKEESNKEESNNYSKSNNNIYNYKKNDEQDILDETTTLASDGTLHISNLSSILVDKGLIKSNDPYMLDFNNLFDHYCHDENGKFDIELFQETKNNIVYIANKLKKSKSQTPIESMFGYFKAAMKDYRKHQNKERARLKEELEAEINSKYSNNPTEELSDEDAMQECERLRQEYLAKQEVKS